MEEVKKSVQDTIADTPDEKAEILPSSGQNTAKPDHSEPSSESAEERSADKPGVVEGSAISDSAEKLSPSDADKKKKISLSGKRKGGGSAANNGNGTKGKKGKKPTRRKNHSTSQLLLRLLIKLGIIALTVWLALTFVLAVTIHYGNNMYPAVRDGDFVVSLRLQRPYINAAVVYEHDGKKCVGRVIGLPGNEIRISDSGEITVNGIIPSEEVFYPTYKAESSGISYPYTVEDDKVFILNDFRSDTYDSRTFGAVDMDDIDGPILLSLRRRGF